MVRKFNRKVSEDLKKSEFPNCKPVNRIFRKFRKKKNSSQMGGKYGNSQEEIFDNLSNLQCLSSFRETGSRNFGHSNSN